MPVACPGGRAWAPDAPCGERRGGLLAPSRQDQRDADSSVAVAEHHGRIVEARGAEKSLRIVAEPIRFGWNAQEGFVKLAVAVLIVKGDGGVPSRFEIAEDYGALHRRVGPQGHGAEAVRIDEEAFLVRC